MRMYCVALAAVAVGVGGAASAQESEKCFDKGTLTYVDCPKEAVEAEVMAEVAPFSWTGFYAGVHGGYADAGFDGVHDNLGGLSLDPLDISGLDASGYTIGGQIGYLHQLENNVVLGVEVDASYINADDAIDNSAIQAAPFETATAEVDWQASARLRAGYAFDRVLPFVTGGVGLIGYEGSVTEDTGPTTLNIDETAIAGVVGAGLEVAVTDSISLRGEGLYYFVDDTTDLNGALPDTSAGDEYSFDSFWTIRAALNVKF